MNVNTIAPQFKADQKLIAYIEQKLGKLSLVFDRIIDCSITLKLENSGQVKDKIAEVRLLVPGSTIVVSETQRTFEAAVDILSDKLRRQLKKYKDRQGKRR